MKFSVAMAATAAVVLAHFLNVLRFLFDSTPRTNLSSWQLIQLVKLSLPPESMCLLTFAAVAAVFGFALDSL
jgi:hypothetical protein